MDQMPKSALFIDFRSLLPGKYLKWPWNIGNDVERHILHVTTFQSCTFMWVITENTLFCLLRKFSLGKVFMSRINTKSKLSMIGIQNKCHFLFKRKFIYIYILVYNKTHFWLLRKIFPSNSTQEVEWLLNQSSINGSTEKMQFPLQHENNLCSFL